MIETRHDHVAFGEALRELTGLGELFPSPPLADTPGVFLDSSSIFRWRRMSFIILSSWATRFWLLRGVLTLPTEIKKRTSEETKQENYLIYNQHQYLLLSIYYYFL